MDDTTTTSNAGGNRGRAWAADMARVLGAPRVGIVELAADGRYTFADADAAAILGRDASAIIGAHFNDDPWEYCTASDAPFADDGHPFDLVLRGQDSAVALDCRLRVAGTNAPRTLTIVTHATTDDAGKTAGLGAVLFDVSGIPDGTAALFADDMRFRVMAETAPAMIWLVGPDKLCIFVNKPWLDFRGRTLAQEIGDGWTEGIHPEDRESAVATFGAAFDRREPFRIEYRVLRHDGEYRWILDQGVPIFDRTKTFAGYIGSCVDITERVAAEQKYRDLAATLETRVAERTAEAERRATQLQRVAVELSQVEQRERERLAKTLHDHIQQLLVAAKMRLSSVRAKPLDDAIRRMLAQVDDLIAQSVEAMRSLAIDLVPPVLRDAGLVAALRWLAQWMQDTHGLRVNLRFETDRVPAPDTQIMLFEAVRELLFNVVKHSGTATAWVVMGSQEPNAIALTVRDHGRGFDTATLGALTSTSETSFGLLNIRERMQMIAGRFELKSVPGQGTTISLIAPALAPGSASGTASGIDSDSDLPAVGSAPRTIAHPTAGAQPKIRVMVVDDHRMVRAGLIGLVEAQPDFEVVGEASDGQAAVDLARQLRPDVVMMDISMPRMNGIDATRLIAGELPATTIIGLSMHEARDMADAMIAAGARTYLRKDGPTDELFAAIRAARPA